MVENRFYAKLGRLFTPTQGATEVREPVPPPAPVRDAFNFCSPLSLNEMKPRLEAGTTWRWWDGDSAYFDYLGARIGPGARMLRLYPRGGRFVLQVRRRATDEDLRVSILERLLPLVNAQDVTPTEGFD